jgi:hypothetical protein
MSILRELLETADWLNTYYHADKVDKVFDSEKDADALMKFLQDRGFKWTQKIPLANGKFQVRGLSKGLKVRESFSRSADEFHDLAHEISVSIAELTGKFHKLQKIVDTFDNNADLATETGTAIKLLSEVELHLNLVGHFIDMRAEEHDDVTESITEDKQATLKHHLDQHAYHTMISNNLRDKGDDKAALDHERHAAFHNREYQRLVDEE